MPQPDTQGAPVTSRQRTRRPRREMSLEQVQRWVGSTFAVFTALHLAAGIALAAVMLDRPGNGDRIGLLVLAAVTGVLGVAGGLAIHRRRVVSAWLLAGTLPALVGAYYTFWSR